MPFQQSVSTYHRVEIYQFKMYSVEKDKSVLSRRWGTRSGIEAVGGQVIWESKTLVDKSALDSDIPGLTVRGYKPC